MPLLSFITHEGIKIEVDSAATMSVMQAATQNDVDGIVGECGGNAMCATCHVYITSGPVDQLPPVGPDEEEMLDSTAAERRGNSRLSCQLPVTDALDGLVMHVPDTQV